MERRSTPPVRLHLHCSEPHQSPPACEKQTPPSSTCRFFSRLMFFLVNRWQIPDFFSPGRFDPNLRSESEGGSALVQKVLSGFFKARTLQTCMGGFGCHFGFGLSNFLTRVNCETCCSWEAAFASPRTAADCLLPEEPAGTGFLLEWEGGAPFFPSEGKPLCVIVGTLLPPAGRSAARSVSRPLCRPQGSTFRVRSVSVGEQWLQHQGAPCRSVLPGGAGLL